MLVRVSPGLFAEVVGRQFSRLLVCDSVGHNCRPMVIEERPVPITEVPRPTQLLLSPVTVTLLPAQQITFIAVALTAAGDTARISDLSWTASGGTFSDITTIGGRHYVRFTAGTATGDFVVVASSPSARLADSAHVHVHQAR